MGVSEYLHINKHKFPSFFNVSARDNFIGFTAYNNVDLFVSEGETVVYNTVQTNAGGGYDTGTGVFTCPVTGLYFFGTATYSAGTIVDIQLMKENTGLMGSFADQNVRKTTFIEVAPSCHDNIFYVFLMTF